MHWTSELDSSCALDGPSSTDGRSRRPRRHIDRASEDPAGSSGPVHYRVEVLPVFDRVLYRPVVHFVRSVARMLEPIQSGDVNWYLLYVLVAVVGCYLAAAH